VETFYAQIGDLIRRENPYGNNLVTADISNNFGDTEDERPFRLNAFKAVGIRVMGFLRDHWATKAFARCNHRLTITQKQQSYHWATLYPEDRTPEYPNDDTAAENAFEPGTVTPPVIQNSADFQLNQVCKALYIPFKYRTPDNRTLDVAILVGYVGSGGGE